jgi:hypothetical protein
MSVAFASRVLAPAINVGRLFHGFARRAAVFAVSYRAAAHRVRAFLSFGRHLNLLSSVDFTAVERHIRFTVGASSPPSWQKLSRRV